MIPIDTQVKGQGQAYSSYVGEGGISVLQTSIFDWKRSYYTYKVISIPKGKKGWRNVTVWLVFVPKLSQKLGTWKLIRLFFLRHNI